VQTAILTDFNHGIHTALLIREKRIKSGLSINFRIGVHRVSIDRFFY